MNAYKKTSEKHKAIQTELPSKRNAYVIILLAYITGIPSMLATWTFFFHGSFNIINLELDEGVKHALNISLCFAFFIQHSVMVRSSFKQWLARFVREEFHSSLYAICSGITLLVLVTFWQQSNHTLIAFQGIPRWIMHGIYILSVIGFAFGVRALGTFDVFGVRQILYYIRGKEPKPVPFTVKGLYRIVRHPLYLFCLMFIWSCPDLTLDRLLFNILWTIWIFAGTIFEERDLVSVFGEEYKEYQKRVPMLLPYRFHFK